MFIMLTVASLCGVVLIANLLRLACRNPETESLWIVSDDAILCFISPVVIALATFGFISLGWRLTHGGFSAVSIEGWGGSALIIAIFVGLWFLLAPRIRGYRRKSGSVPSGSTQAKT